MRQAGQLALLRFPDTSLQEGKLRPVLLLGKLPGEYDDWLICLVSTQLRHFVREFDEIVGEDAPDFAESGLKAPSVIRLGRRAGVEGSALPGAIGKVALDRLRRAKNRLARWLSESQDAPEVELLK